MIFYQYHTYSFIDLTCTVRYVYQLMPTMVTHTPRNFFKGMASPYMRQPPVKMMTVFKWPAQCDSQHISIMVLMD